MPLGQGVRQLRQWYVRGGIELLLVDDSCAAFLHVNLAIIRDVEEHAC